MRTPSQCPSLRPRLTAEGTHRVERVNGHRAYILEVDRDAQGTKERVTLLVDYGRNQARVEIVVAGLTRKTDQAEIYRGELAELAHALTEIVQSPPWTSLDV